MKKQTCLSCCHFRQHDPHDLPRTFHLRCASGWGGECRRDPPLIRLAHTGQHDALSAAVWPLVRASEWCGRHEPKMAVSIPAKARAETGEIVLKWNRTVLPVVCTCCERPFTPPDGPCLTFEGTWAFVCLECASRLAPQAARDCRLLQVAQGREQVPQCKVEGWTPHTEEPVSSKAG